MPADAPTTSAWPACPECHGAGARTYYPRPEVETCRRCHGSGRDYGTLGD